jgi:GNAT superfamily N-acetyltransferase
MAMADVAIALRAPAPRDARLIADFVRELAAYERLPNEVAADETMLAAALFAKEPRVFCVLADYDGEPAGFILWFYTFSTFRGRHGIWVEDLYVREQFRGKGIGAALLTTLARRCVDEDLGRLEWSVLDWNKSAIAFYESTGARLLDNGRCAGSTARLWQISPPRKITVRTYE